VICCGVGALGAEIVRLIDEKQQLNAKIVAAVDVAPEVVGRDLGEVAGLDKKLGVTVSGSVGTTLESVSADVVIYAAEPHFDDMFPAVRVALENGKNVITAGDEACFPWAKHAALAEEADLIAKENGVSFLGTGVCPGFMMDYLPIALTGVMKHVDKVTIQRIADTSGSGLNYYEKCGYGKSPEEFDKALRAGTVAGPEHLKEEVLMIAQALGWEGVDYTEEKRGLISETRREALSGTVEPGTISGVEQISCGMMDGREVIRLVYDIIIHPEEDGLEVGNFKTISGEGGELTCSVTGDLAKQSWSRTAAIVVNTLPQVVAAEPGIRTVYELPPSPCIL
jgi:4-hydroxy-tetrahydrodipicolinate reductase